MTSLFDPLQLRDLTLRNRLILPPMCTYQCPGDGVPNDWHVMHYGARAAGGFALVIAEACGVVPDGRITPRCTGLWNDTQTAAWKRVTDIVHAQGAAAGIQLSHSGRKGSTYPGTAAKSGSVPAEAGGWETIAPSAIPYPGLATPREATVAELQDVVAAFAAAAQRADAAGFDVIELHAAHGYLLFEMLSPLSNHRTDAYGGDFNSRTKLLVDTADAVRAVWPAHKPLLVRISASEWVAEGWNVPDTIRLAELLKTHGVDFVDVSSGGNVPAKMDLIPGYQVGFARQVKAAGLPVSAVGLITKPEQAAQIVTEGSADAVCIGRAALSDPNWPLHAARELGLSVEELPIPPSYARANW